MPIYEFYCRHCHRVLSFLSRAVNTDKVPACPRCGRTDLVRRASAFAISKGRKEETKPETPPGRHRRGPPREGHGGARRRHGLARRGYAGSVCRGRVGLDAAIQRVGREIAIAHPELADELSLVSLELRAGKSREEALRSLGERTGVEAVQSLASLLIQAEHFGTSIASALREHAEEMRTLRLQKAREKAAKLPVKMIFPIMFFIFPALFFVIHGPALVRIYAGFISGF